MIKINNKNLIFLILIIVCVAVVSSVVLWCVKKQENKPVVENDSNKQTIEQKNKLEEVFEHPEKFEAEVVFKEEVDTSNWFYYENEVYSLYYPKELELIKNPLNGERELV